MDVPVQPAPGGPLSDHYDPRQAHRQPLAGRLRRPLGRVRRDRRARGRARDPAPEGVRAVQAAQRAVPGRRVRVEDVDLPPPAGIFVQITGLALVAIILFAVVVLFQLVTLPVEFDASRRAKQQLQLARARQRRRGERREPGAQRRGADLRRGRARRADAARVLRAHLPRQPQLDPATCGRWR